MPAIVLVFVLMMATLGLYNKARYGVYLPFKKEGRDCYKKRMVGSPLYLPCCMCLVFRHHY